jgi:hypothetical protein
MILSLLTQTQNSTIAMLWTIPSLMLVALIHKLMKKNNPQFLGTIGWNG